MTPMMKALVAQLSPDLAKTIEQGQSLHAAIGAALTPEQQLNVSSLVAAGPDKFIAWTRTDEGRAAVQALADKFTSASA
jgi:sarcosine oxidase gamma subunit